MADINMMIGNELLLKVPADKQLREDIRQKVENHFFLNTVAPPVSYERLTALAEDLISEHGWDGSYKAFVMVCSGNAVWRPVVGSIPYHRRMLLLPQCLKNSQLCKGSYDELGLLCSECGNCNISGFLSEAEDLGYITIVSEGTTVASRLVESGSVDAIVGVGCMEVLQKMFSAVRKYTVPAIGIPLLSCGCIDTKADAEWIREEMRWIDPHSGFSLLNLSNLKSRTDSLFTEKQVDSILGLNDSVTEKIVKEVLLSGGKRIRPLLTVLAYEAFSTHPDLVELNHLALSVECFHKASLIHDDIEDNDLSRYGKETIHARYGIPVALNIGDLLLGEGYRLIAECNLTAEITRDLLKAISKGHKALSLGQGAELLAQHGNEILTMNEILYIFENKTSAAFRVSLMIGAIAAGATEESLSQLDNFSHLIGIAYQMKDDLEDFMPGSDSSAVQVQSAIMAMLAEKADAADRESLKEAVSTNNAEMVQKLVKKYSVREELTSLLRDYLHQTEICLGDIQNIRLKLALNEIVGKTFRDYI
jgi:geranylgeranyl diphosphate synthase, type II